MGPLYYWCYDQTKNWITGFENHCATKWDITLLKHCTKICFNPLCLRLRASPNYWFHCGIVTLCLYFGDLSIFKEFLLSQFLLKKVYDENSDKIHPIVPGRKPFEEASCWDAASQSSILLGKISQTPGGIMMGVIFSLFFHLFFFSIKSMSFS